MIKMLITSINQKMITSKRSFLFSIALLIGTTAAIPNVQASQTLLNQTIDGDVWKVNSYPKLLRFKLKKNGTVKCNTLWVQYKQFLSCSTGYLGSNYYDEIYDAIKSKI